MDGKKWFVYASPQMVEFAGRFGTVLKIDREQFSNGFPNFFVGLFLDYYFSFSFLLFIFCFLFPDGIEDIAKVLGGANILFFHYYKTMEEKIFEQMILFLLADTYNIKNLVVVDPYDPSATMERVTEEVGFFSLLFLLFLLLQDQTLKLNYFFLGSNCDSQL